MVGMIILSTNLVPLAWRIDGSSWAVIFPLSILIGCHLLFPVRTSAYVTPVQALICAADCPQPVVDGVLILSAIWPVPIFVVPH